MSINFKLKRNFLPRSLLQTEKELNIPDPELLWIKSVGREKLF